MKHLHLIIIFWLLPALSFAQPGITKYDINKKHSSYFGSPLVHKGVLYFQAAVDSLYGVEACMYDDINPPKMIKDLNKGIISGHFFPILGYQDSVYFLAYDNIHYELSIFRYDIVNDTIDIIWGEDIEVVYNAYAALNSKLYYAGYHKTDKLKRYVFEYDVATGVEDTILTLPAVNTTSPHMVYNLTVLNNQLYINEGGSFFENNLFAFDIISRTMDTVVHNAQYRVSKNIAHLNGKLYFVLPEPSTGSELYEYDGINSPNMVVDYHAGADNSIIAYEHNNMIVYNNELYFTGFILPGLTPKLGLLKYSPSTNAITPVCSMNKELQIDRKFVYNGKLYMSAADSLTGWELYVYDGSNNPYMVVEIATQQNGAPKSAYISDFIAYKGDLFFGAQDASVDREMYRYNDSLLSIAKVKGNSIRSITAYPNPTTGNAQLNVTLSQAQTLAVQLTDINGRVVYIGDSKLYSKGAHLISLPMQQLSAGTYIYTMTDNTGSMLNSGRVMKR